MRQAQKTSWRGFVVSDEFGTVPKAWTNMAIMTNWAEPEVRPHKRQRRKEVRLRAQNADMARESPMGWVLKALTVSMAVRAVSMEVEALEVWERSCAMRGDAKDWDADWMMRMGREARITEVSE
jgi:hypothetical protein